MSNNFTLPKKLDGFTAYEPLTGEYPVRLDVNESFIDVPADKVARAIEKVKLNRYPDPYATEAVGAFARLFGVEPRQVTAGNGSDELIGLIAAGLLEKGDKLATVSPDFPMYAFYASLYEVEVVRLPNLLHIPKDVKCVMFSNPCNPTSLGIEKSEIERLIRSTNALVVLDEAYMDFWCGEPPPTHPTSSGFGEPHSMLSEVGKYNNLVVLRTCSKSVALAGIRMGFAVANEEITAALKTVKSPFNVNSLSQAIAAEILSDADGYRASIALIKQSITSLKAELESMDIFECINDSKTNFVYARTAKCKEIYDFLLTRGIAVRCFPEHLRICAGTPSENQKLIKELKEWQIQQT
jgi:histidinol-phosphate aminotransferase